MEPGEHVRLWPFCTIRIMWPFAGFAADHQTAESESENNTHYDHESESGSEASSNVVCDPNESWFSLNQNIRPPCVYSCIVIYK